jgi:hypothetical protein
MMLLSLGGYCHCVVKVHLHHLATEAAINLIRGIAWLSRSLRAETCVLAFATVVVRTSGALFPKRVSQQYPEKP